MRASSTGSARGRRGTTWASRNRSRGHAAPHRADSRALRHRRRGDSARTASTSRSTRATAPARDHARAARSGSAAKCTRSMPRRTAAFPGPRSRSPRTWGSSSSWFGETGCEYRALRLIRTSIGSRSSPTEGGDRRGLHPRARGPGRAVATAAGSGRHEPVDEPDRRRRRAPRSEAW